MPQEGLQTYVRALLQLRSVSAEQRNHRTDDHRGHLHPPSAAARRRHEGWANPRLEEWQQKQNGPHRNEPARRRLHHRRGYVPRVRTRPLQLDGPRCADPGEVGFGDRHRVRRRRRRGRQCGVHAVGEPGAQDTADRVGEGGPAGRLRSDDGLSTGDGLHVGQRLADNPHRRRQRRRSRRLGHRDSGSQPEIHRVGLGRRRNGEGVRRRRHGAAARGRGRMRGSAVRRRKPSGRVDRFLHLGTPRRQPGPLLQLRLGPRVLGEDRGGDGAAGEQIVRQPHLPAERIGPEERLQPGAVQGELWRLLGSHRLDPVAPACRLLHNRGLPPLREEPDAALQPGCLGAAQAAR